MSQANTSGCATMSLIAITIQGIGDIYIYIYIRGINQAVCVGMQCTALCV